MCLRTGIRAAAQRALAAGLFVSLGLNSSALAGDLNPPPGAIAPTMLRLDQIEPRIIVNELPGAANAVHVISANGNYVVTAPVVPAGVGQHGILVTAPDVTIDLNGFTLVGGPGSLDGIRVDTITPASFSVGERVNRPHFGASISGFDGNGVTVLNAAGVSLAGLTISDCGGNGIAITTSFATISYDCRIFQEMRVTGCGGNGIDITLTPSVTAGATYTFRLSVTDTSSNAGHGVVVRGSGFPPPLPGGQEGGVNIALHKILSSSNGGDGLRFEFDSTIRPSITLRECNANRNALSGLNVVRLTPDATHEVTIIDDDFSFNGSNGITVSGDLTVDGLRCNDNIGDGIEYVAGTALRKRKISIEKMIGDSNGGNGASFTWPGGSYTSIVRDSSFTGNTLDGLNYRDLDSDDDGLCESIGVIANNNGGGGIVVRALDSGAQFCYRDCTVTLNGGTGIDQIGGSGRFVGCNALNNGGPGVETIPAMMHPGVYIFEINVSAGNTGAGFLVSGTGEFNGCSAINNGSHGYGVVGDSFILDGSSSQGNAGDGFNFVADSVVMIDCAASNNLGDGCDISAPLGSVTLLAIKAGAYFGNGGSGINASGTHAAISHISVYGNLSSGISASNSSLNCSNVAVGANLAGGVVGTDLIQIIMDVCTINNNAGNGVLISTSPGVISGPVTMRRCSFTGNTGTGCSIAGSIGGQITECSAFNNGIRGIEVLSSGHVLTNNVVSANPLGNVFAASPGNAVGPSVGASVIGGDNNFANTNP